MHPAISVFEWCSVWKWWICVSVHSKISMAGAFGQHLLCHINERKVLSWEHVFCFQFVLFGPFYRAMYHAFCPSGLFH